MDKIPYNDYEIVLETGDRVHVHAHWFSGDDRGVLRFFIIPPQGCKKGDGNVVARFQKFLYVIQVGIVWE